MSLALCVSFSESIRKLDFLNGLRSLTFFVIIDRLGDSARG